MLRQQLRRMAVKLGQKQAQHENEIQRIQAKNSFDLHHRSDSKLSKVGTKNKAKSWSWLTPEGGRECCSPLVGVYFNVFSGWIVIVWNWGDISQKLLSSKYSPQNVG